MKTWDVEDGWLVESFLGQEYEDHEEIIDDYGEDFVTKIGNAYVATEDERSEGEVHIIAKTLKEAKAAYAEWLAGEE